MLVRRFGVLAAMIAAVLAPAAGISATPNGQDVPLLIISGAVADPAAYTLSQLAALPAETAAVPGPGGHGMIRATGVSLDQLVTAASPVLPAFKNALLRVVVTAKGPGRAESFAQGELDPGFGNHDALIVVSLNGRLLPVPALMVPGDRDTARDLPRVSQIRIGWPVPRSPSRRHRVPSSSRTAPG